MIYSHIPLIHWRLLKHRGIQVCTAEVLQIAPLEPTIPGQFAFFTKK